MTETKDLAMKKQRMNMIQKGPKKFKPKGVMKYKIQYQLIKGKPGGYQNMYWLLDTSGSMCGDRLDQLKETVQEMLVKYPNVHLVEFGGRVQRISEDRIPHLYASGLTPMFEALEIAWNNRAELIVLVTDGEPTDQDPDQIVSEASYHDVPICCLGMGEDFNRDFLERLSLATGGEMAEVGDEELHLLTQGFDDVLQITHQGDSEGTISL